MSLLEQDVDRLAAAQRNLAELSTQFRDLLEPYIHNGGVETLADTVNMTVDELRDIADCGAYGVPVARLVQLAWALDMELRFDLGPSKKEH